ncbi:hypothetical protein [Rubrolithibacter danxiaensis]|uniref:hypothetical protein n=1 Tax=Rubrolithibacter danxiaensis TaxID=3390805 RepID=UPI003BF7E069
MKTPKKTESKTSKNGAIGGAKKLISKADSPKPKSRFLDEEDDDLDEPLDDLGGFDNLSDFDDDEDY